MKIEELIKGYGNFKDKKFKKYQNKFLDLVENHSKHLINKVEQAIKPEFTKKFIKNYWKNK